jgi:maleate cis-trans isomerase
MLATILFRVCLPVPSLKTKIKIYKTIILPVILYGCETWSLILGEDHRLRMSENRVLRRMSGAKMEEGAGWL